MWVVYFGFLYGVLSIVGGVIGFLKAGSKPSLISGTISGLVIIANTWALLKGSIYGYYGLMAISILVAVFFAIRFAKTLAFMPAGLMMILSAICLAGLVLQKGKLGL